ncbi:competence protein ComGF [Bacillus pakistanensis]|uniref:Competence protein ComGF n=1 Tax=Rossellomorea pakistanensis TaxID=992288 RepID=A0ABS2N9U1_9BACI|nr:competence protein ComGF [Bacillus pakistanensis]
MIETIFVLSIFMMISFCVPLLIKGLETIDEHLVPRKSYEWNLYTFQFRNEFRGSYGIEYGKDSVSFIKGSREVTYEKYGHSLRRRIDRRGHEIVLQDVKAVTISSLTNGVQITVTFTDNQILSSSFFTYSSLEGEGGNGQ